MIKTTDTRIAKVLAALQSGDAAHLQELCHPDLVIEDPPSLPYGGRYVGFGGMLEVAQKLTATWTDCEIATEAIIGDPSSDRVVLLQRMKGRSVRTGQVFETPILELYTFREGLLVSIRPFYWDTKALIDLDSEP